MFVYLNLQLIFFVIPLILLWFFFWKMLLPYIKIYLFTIIPTFLFGTPWDLLSVRSGLWNYNTSGTLGIWFFGNPSTGLPLEEFIFFNFLWPFFITTVVIIGWQYFKKYVW
ncbi:MAG: lycopene cyclase domain-containing protein [Candidatus Levybacteria bacterium]|nr:lycopene cyclase domain-containing protein [Candidatus Levybacteria bacterium]